MSWAADRTYGAESVPTLTAMRARKAAAGARVGIVVAADPDDSAVATIDAAITENLVDATGLADRVVIVDTGAGRGQALWRNLRGSDEAIIVWIDGGIRNFSPRIVARLLAPLLLDDTLEFVKGFSSKISPKSAGRADPGVARSLLAAGYPELDEFVQPFSREGAARTSLLRRLPFVAGEGVDAGLLIDAFHEAGLDAMGQADIGGSLHRTRPVFRYDGDIARTILRRAEERGRKRAFADAAVYPLLVRDQASSLPDLPALERPRVRPSAAASSRLIRLAT